MSKNLIIDGKTLTGVTALKAKDADTGNLVSFPDTSDATATASDITSGKSAYVNGVKLNGTNTGVSGNDLDGLIDGTLTTFIMPSGKTTILQYRFYQFSNLVSANLGGADTIEQYAFDGCTKLATLSLPITLTDIGAYAFRSVGSGQSATFVLNPEDACSVGTYAFNNSKIQKVAGKYSSIGTYAFATCNSLTQIDIDECSSIGNYAFQNDYYVTNFAAKVNGSIGAYAFYNLYAVSNCDFDVNSVISSLGNYAFSRFGSNRANASSNIITLDLRNSTFTSIPQYSFGGDSSSTSYRNKYMRIFLPETVSTVSSYAFRYTDNCDFYFASKTPPTLSATTCWSNATNYNIFVPYYAVNTYRIATNWTAQADYIKGYAPANTFEIGDTLPALSSEGYGLTWYSDASCTTAVTSVEDANAIYYCIAGTEKIAYGITSVTAINCNVVITDSAGKEYKVDEGVLVGTTLTITIVPNPVGYIKYIYTVNGQDITSGDTYTVEEDLSVTALCWDGEDIPIHPVFEKNTWIIIFNAFRNGIASTFWSVGDTKPVTLTDGRQYTIRIADMTMGRYPLANGSGSSNGVLEFVECINMGGTTSFPINSTAKEGYWTGGGWAACDMHNATMASLYNLLPADMQAAISEISTTEYSYSSPSPRTTTNKLFIPAETEIFDARHYSAEGVQTGCVKYNQFGYYAANNTNAYRIKYTVGTTSARWWWLRSPYSGNSYYFCVVGSSGSYGYNDANFNGGVSPCFAI